MTRLVGPGSPEPLGVVPVDRISVAAKAAVDGGGVNVAVYAPNAEAIDFCLFDQYSEDEIESVRLPGRTGGVHHGAIGRVRVGDRYGLRAHGPFRPADGHRFNPAKLLIDPFATRFDRPFRLDPLMFDRRASGQAEDAADSAAIVPKAIVEAPASALPRRALHPWRDLVIYEMHVKGFTQRLLDVPPDIRGTFAGLAHPAAIRHLSELGVTAVELLPVAAGLDERHLATLGLTNYWNYNPIAPLSPDLGLAPGGFDEIAAAVDALHAAGIAVILDVVLNHSGECDHLGPTVSFRGLDNAAWYRLNPDDKTRIIDDAGCGNTLRAEKPHVVRLMLDALRTWAIRARLDGFRFDLATTLARGPNGFDPDHPFLAAVSQDPVLRDLILIAEPWDIGWGGYQLGQFPSGWGEWNDRFRDVARRFWRGEDGLIGAFTTNFAGSADFLAPKRRPVSRSVNFVTAHDGFTLADLVAFETKHNEANGEENRDGTNANHSWNHGVEGPTSDAAVIEKRRRDQRGLLATLILARGTPMLSMGDEIGRTQRGNNNAYAQDNDISWMDWARADRDLMTLAAKLIRLRRSLPALNAEAVLTGAPAAPGLLPDVSWLNASGQPMQTADWINAQNRLLIARFGAGEADGADVLVAINAGSADVNLVLPEPGEGRAWWLDVDTADPTGEGAVLSSARYLLPARSVAVGHEVASAVKVPRLAGDDAAALGQLAGSAGISPDWWDVSGKRTEVKPDTKRAILTAMGLSTGSTAEIRDSLARLSARHERVLPQTLVARAGGAIIVPLGGELARSARAVELIVRREDGVIEEFSIPARAGEEVRVIAADGAARSMRNVGLPAQPMGRHRLILAERPELATDLVVVPQKCYLPAVLDAGGRRFGLATHLYSLRRNGDQGIGDFTTLAQLAEWAGGNGAVTIGLNPLHAMFPTDRERASPYNPSDRRFLDPIYIDVTNLPAVLRGDQVRTALWSEARVDTALSQLPSVDYVRVWQSKKRVLDLAFAAFERTLAGAGATALAQEFDAFVDRGGPALQRFAEFHTLADEIGHTDWREWPADGIAALRPDKREQAIRYHSFLQWLADKQFGEAAAAGRAKGLTLGFYRDLAVGCAPDGAESWSERERLMQGLSIGAPPDPFSTGGQVWSLPPPNPLRMAEDGYAAFSALIAANMVHAGALRIDHAMGLRRLFVVPDGASGKDGAYVDMPFGDLLGLTALESQRAKCIVVGEDLGTVPDGFRERLAEADVLSYKVLWFERQGANFRDFTPPKFWPARSAACVSTHDLATLAGWWQGADIAEKFGLDFLSAEAVAGARAIREEEKAALGGLLVAEKLLPIVPDPLKPLTDEAIAAVHALVFAAPSVIALAQLDDLVGETRAVNLPGTDRERPNWRRKLSPDWSALIADRKVIEIVRQARRERGG
ncbi:MAG: glycogen debranching protein GlgX [Ancalomicrobiaceae bacterium]|nr:glycogen debranching protein GlgX [Ancalomicrobiaceae bacterium]